MDRSRILKEAQKLATQYSFWMVSGNISHLYGYVYETPEKKYEIEIKFGDNFPEIPPHITFYKDINELLGDVQLNSLDYWDSESSVLDIVQELNKKISGALNPATVLDYNQINGIRDNNGIKTESEIREDNILEANNLFTETDEYITPDLNMYSVENDDQNVPVEHSSGSDFFYDDQKSNLTPQKPQNTLITGSEVGDVTTATELSLIQQEYAYDQRTEKLTDINVYITITITKTFIIHVDFANYPGKPSVIFPAEARKILGDPFQSIISLKKWNSKKPPHIVEILREIEKKLLSVKEIESELRKIQNEYQFEQIPGHLANLRVHLLTFGFKEYLLDVDLSPYPNPPLITLSSDLKEIIGKNITELSAYKNWKEKESEVVGIIREVSWLVDKNSRINFEIELLKEHYKNIKYDSLNETLRVDMKGKMKTQDITFEFEIELPIDYPMEMPKIQVLNEFELETHEKIKSNLLTSFNDFFDEWTPFSYLVDLFNLISKKIFEVSIVSCVICHKIECPSCAKKIAGDENCHAECPHCEKHYHLHCWQQTVKSFGKCGFCLKTPPPSMM